MRKAAAALFVLVGLFAHAAEPLRVVIVSGSWEYKSEVSMPVFQKHLEANYNAKVTLLQAPARDKLPGLEALDQCDVALFFSRRLTITGDALKRVKRYCTSGNPVVAVRTASHGIQNWLDFDKRILGGNYHGHYKKGEALTSAIVDGAKDHPVLKGVTDFTSEESLYKTTPLAKDATLLMTGNTPKANAPEPVAWARTVKGGRVFYTGLGGVKDFENPVFRRMVVNALFWTAGRDVEPK
ncbi:ThuA domain-containing protein [bacterium]|nr:ThuA domain-containing protein [bacterium]